MATTTRARLRALLAGATGFYYSGTNTGTATDTVVDTEIQRWDTGRLTDRWVLMTGGNNDGNSRRVSSVTTSTATVLPAWGAANANGNTFEFLPFDPDVMHRAIEEAIRTSWPKPTRRSRAPRGLYQKDPNETLVVDNLVSNWDFETNTTGPVAFTGWTITGGGTFTAETTRVWHGAQSAAAVAGAAGGIEQNLFTATNVDDIVTKMIHIRAAIWETVASSTRLSVSFDGSTFTYGAYHGGGEEWEDGSTMYIDTGVPTGATEMTVAVEWAAGSAPYIDNVVAWIDPVTEYTMSTAFYPNGPSQVYIQRDSSRPNGLYVPLQESVPGRILRLTGMQRLSVPTTDAGTVEIDETEAEFLVAEAAMHMFRVLKNEEPENADRYEKNEAYWIERADELRGSVGHLGLPAGERKMWSVSGDDSRILRIHR